MKYILTQKEYDELTQVTRLQESNEALEQARLLIVELSGVKCGTQYCDLCPVSDIRCKDWNTKIDTRESKLICPLSRKYSK